MILDFGYPISIENIQNIFDILINLLDKQYKLVVLRTRFYCDCDRDWVSILLLVLVLVTLNYCSIVVLRYDGTRVN